jgi:hypothetical protein
VRRDEPLATVPRQDEQVVEAGGIQMLHQPAPALVAAARAEGDIPTSSEERARLHLHSRKIPLKLGHEVVVRVVTQRERDLRALACQPNEGR